MVKGKMVKVIHLLFALVLTASMLPLAALPVAAHSTPGTPHLDEDDGGVRPYNILGHIERYVPSDLGGASVTGWSVSDVMTGTDATILASQTASTPPPGPFADLVASNWGEANLFATLSSGGPLKIAKKWGKIDRTVITGPQSVPVKWDENEKAFVGSVKIKDVVVGTFRRQNLDTHLEELYEEPAEGALLDWFLLPVAVEGLIPTGPEDPDDVGGVKGLRTKVAELVSQYPTRCVSFGKPLPFGSTSLSGTSNDKGEMTVTVRAVCEEAAVVVVVPGYPAPNDLKVRTEKTKVNFWTYEMEKVPQVRWAGEKIVLEKCFGENWYGLPVRFALEQQSVGALEAADSIQLLNVTNSRDTVWTLADDFGCAEVILTSESPGEADVVATLYADLAFAYIINQHGFVVFFLKLEEVKLGNVEGKREGHNQGRWTPPNPGDVAATEDDPHTLNVSQDALLRARVKGWFLGDNLSGRTEACQDTDPQADTWDMTPPGRRPGTDGNPTNDCDILLPAGRWVLPDDWPALAGPDWKQLRIHWDIMDNPFDCIASLPPEEVGPYHGCDAKSLEGHGSLVAEAPVIGPFNPAWEIPTPTKYDTGIPPWAPFKTVVPNGVLEWWDAPMPPAKITFKIKSGPGFFKEADKGDIYYLPHGPHLPVADYPGFSVDHIHYTNPFYKVMIPAHWKIPAFVNNGGYDWDSWSRWFGPYDFWTIVNRPPNDEVKSTDVANYPTKVQVYSDNHGEAMAYLNGDWNLKLDRWLTNGAYDIKPGTEVGVTKAEAMADYPYFRKHPALVSNPVTKKWTWGKEILGADPKLYPDGQTDPADTRMVFQVGTLKPQGTTPETYKSDKKMVLIWVSDRDGFPAKGEQIDWAVQTAVQNLGIPDFDGCGVSNFNDTMKAICMENGFLAGTNGTPVPPPAIRTQGTSWTRSPTKAEKDLFKKKWPTKAVSGYAVAGIELISSVEAKVDLLVILHEREGNIERHVNVDWAVADSPDEPIVPPLGDANMDGTINMGDVTLVERMILGLSAETSYADVNGDREVDMGDVIRIERLILGLDL